MTATIDIKRSGINPWKALPADPAEFFSAEEIAKAKDYVRPLRRVGLLEKAIVVLVDLAVVRSHLVPELLDSLDVRNWIQRLLITVFVVTVIGTLVAIPFGVYRELVYDKRWGFSTQTTKGFATDTVKSLLLGPVILTLITLPLWFVIRHTDLWWVFGWLVVAAISLGLGVLSPVLIDPIFNKFKRIDDDDLHADLVGLAKEVGSDIHEVQVSDASRRTRKHNAYVTGMGRTRKLVIFDTLLEEPRPSIRSVAAHEIGHWKLRHIRRHVPLGIALLLVNFLAVKLVLDSGAVLRFAGVDSLRDPAALPLFFLIFPLPGIVTGLLQAWFIRAGEREADLFALEATQDPDAASDMERNLHVKNLADLAPSRWKRLTADHPPAAERLAMIEAWRRAASN
ncbi:MAG: M48 family metallopeptidase [Actinobacteria bacterium]|nr:M48 family metallopeptidase [Actinomycetota bacterium]